MTIQLATSKSGGYSIYKHLFNNHKNTDEFISTFININPQKNLWYIHRYTD